jgi:hypothetical protein
MAEKILVQEAVPLRQVREVSRLAMAARRG